MKKIILINILAISYAYGNNIDSYYEFEYNNICINSLPNEINSDTKSKIKDDCKLNLYKVLNNQNIKLNSSKDLKKMSLKFSKICGEPMYDIIYSVRGKSGESNFIVFNSKNSKVNYSYNESNLHFEQIKFNENEILSEYKNYTSCRIKVLEKVLNFYN